jgi:hypothetical protein
LKLILIVLKYPLIDQVITMLEGNFMHRLIQHILFIVVHSITRND